MLKKLTIKNKNRLLVALVGVIILVTGYLAISLTVSSVFHERRLKAKTLTELAHTVLQHNYDRFKAGEISEDQAKADAMETLRPMVYGDNGYFFLYSRDGTVVMLAPKPELEGQNKIDLKDPNGVFVIQELVNVTANGNGGFVSYHWDRPGDDKPVPKVSYAIGFQPWDYFIGTGNYETDIYSQVAELLKREVSTVILSAFIFFSLIWALIMLGRNTLAQIMSVKSNLESFAEGDFSHDINVYGNDEFTLMQQSMVQVQTNMKATLNELGDTIDSARAGDLASRVSLDDKNGFYLKISQSVNELVEISENVVDDTSRIFAAMSNGNLNERIEKDYHGSFNKLKQDANATIEKINQVINVELQSVVDSASNGDLGRRISLDDKDGFYNTLSTGLNTMVDSVERLFSDMAVVLEAMSNGNLTQPITNEYPGSFNTLKEDTNKTIETVNKIVVQLLSVADALSDGAKNIDQGNNELSNRTESQAAALEETASSMEQISSTVSDNASNTQHADSLACSARERAEKGDIVVSQAITAMNDISAASSKISEIIGVIDELAFQTNLLALNASVEAARAGEQGRGFAVVADEVRNLAGRSATAAREIKDLIEDSASKVDVGFKLVNDTGETLAEILGSVKEVETVIGQISLKGEEQSSGVKQVNQAIMGLDVATQQNAALAQEASTSARTMKTSTDEMRSLIGFFQVCHDSGKVFSDTQDDSGWMKQAS